RAPTGGAADAPRRAGGKWRVAASEPRGEKDREPCHAALLVVFRRFGRCGRRDLVLFGRPVAEVDGAAALAAERKLGRADRHFLFANRTANHTATGAAMLISPLVTGRGARSADESSVGGSNVPSTS